MNYCEKKRKIDYLIELIESESTGNPDQLANYLRVSRPTLFRYLQDLQDVGVNISYCFKRETYYQIKNVRQKLK